MENSKFLKSIKVFFAVACLGGLVSTAAATVPPEVATPVELSSTDVNRIVCPTEVKDVITSQEKGAKIRTAGKDVFIKFLIKQEGDKELYLDKPLGFYIVCDGGLTYNVIGVPKVIGPQTVYLSGESAKANQNLEVFKGNTIETKILRIIKAAYKEAYPGSFNVEDITSGDELFYEGIHLRLRRIVKIPGEGLVLKEFTITAQAEVSLAEKAFLPLEKKTIAVSLSVMNLKKGETSRLFVLSRGDNE